MRTKILLLNTTFRFEGPNDVLWQLARHVDGARFELIFGCMHEGGPMEKIYNEAGFRTQNFDMTNFFRFRSVLRVKDFVRAEKIDLVMAQLLRAEVFGGYGARLAGIPLIVVVQNADPYRANRRLFPHYYLSRHPLKWADMVVAVSESVRKFVIKHQGVCEEKIVTIYDSIDTDQFALIAHERSDMRSKFNICCDAIVIGAVARFAPQKGLKYLLDAFHEVSFRHKNIVLLLVGDGIQLNHLKMLALDMGIRDRVIFTGFRRDYDKIMQAFDIFVIPSLWEGMPMALMAAMASGKAVVATNICGIPELIQDGLNGLLVPPADSGALAEKIEMLIRDGELRKRLGAAARDYTDNNCSSRTMTSMYEKLWEECLRMRT